MADWKSVTFNVCSMNVFVEKLGGILSCGDANVISGLL